MNLLNMKNPSSAEFVSNSSSFRPQSSKNSRLNPLVKKLNHDHGFGCLEASTSASNFSPTVAHQQQQIFSNALGVRPVTDRMSKEKQKFFRFSVFNSERKSKLVKSTKQKLLSINNNNNLSTLKSSTNNLAITNTSTQPLVGHDKYKFETSSDSENERVNDCDIASKTINNVKKAKEKNTNVTKSKKSSQTLSKDCTTRQSNSHVKSKQKVKKNHSLTSEDDSMSSYCSSDDENSASSSESSSDSSSDSGSSSSSSSGSCSSSSANKNRNLKPTTSLLNKTEAINTMNVFACINSRELANQTGNSYCWSTMPFSASQQNDGPSLFKTQPQKFYNPFGLATRSESDNAWGFAAEAKKAVNIFNSNSDSEKNRKIKKKQSSSALNESSSILAMTNRLSKHKLANEYFATNRRTTTLMRNNIIMSSDDDAKQMSPSKMFRKAVNYKKFDNHKLNNKKLIMDPNANDGHCADNPVKADSNSKIELSQSPYHNSKNNHLELGKKQSSFSQKKDTGRKFLKILSIE
jgi:hypothetical protein